MPEFGVSMRKRIDEKLPVYTGEMVALLLLIRGILCSNVRSTSANLFNNHSNSCLSTAKKKKYMLSSFGNFENSYCWNSGLAFV